MKFKTYHRLYNLRSKVVLLLGVLSILISLVLLSRLLFSTLLPFLKLEALSLLENQSYTYFSDFLLMPLLLILGNFLVISGLKGVGSLPIDFYIDYKKWCETNGFNSSEESISLYVDFLLENDLPMPKSKSNNNRSN